MADTRTCPSGHKHPIKQFTTYVDLAVEEADDAVIFTCPGGKRDHKFTLRKAVAGRMFNKEEAANIRTAAVAHIEKYKP